MALDELNIENISFGGEPPKQDPIPGGRPKKSTSRSNGSNNRPPGRPSRDTKVREVAAELEGFLKLANLGLMSRDLHQYDDNTYGTCLGVYVGEHQKTHLPVLTMEGQAFVNAAANIIVDNDFLMKMLDSGDKAGKWLQLAMAIQPLVMTVIQNHGRGRVRTEASSE